MIRRGNHTFNAVQNGVSRVSTTWKSQGKLENSGNSMSSGKSGKTQGILIFSLEKYLFCDIDKKSFQSIKEKNIHMQPANTT